MYWSTFSVEWYEITLRDLGFEFVSKGHEFKENAGLKEEVYYLLYKKPVATLPSPPPVASVSPSNSFQMHNFTPSTVHSHSIANNSYPTQPQSPSMMLLNQVMLGEEDIFQ